MKRLGIYIAVLLVLLISVSFWLGSSAESQIEALLGQTQQQIGPEYQLTYSTVSVSPFAGNINVENLAINEQQAASRYSVGNLELDLSYIDFLRVYLKGMEQGLHEISGMQINLSNPGIRIDSLQISAEELRFHHRGPTHETLKALLQNRRPETSVYLDVEADQLTLNSGQSFDAIEAHLNYDPALGHLALQRMDINDPTWEGTIRGSIRLKTASTTMNDWAELALEYDLLKQQEPDQILYESSGLGRVFGASLEATGSLAEENLTATEFWDRFPMQLPGSHELTAKTLTWKPATSLTERYMPLMALQTAQPNGVRIDEFHLNLDRSMRSNRMIIEDMTLKTPMMRLRGEGALQLYPGDFMAARFVRTTLTADQFSAGMKQMIQGAARFFNIQNADRDQYRLRISGPLRAPQFLSLE
jgi:hypothetical protein